MDGVVGVTGVWALAMVLFLEPELGVENKSLDTAPVNSAFANENSCLKNYKQNFIIISFCDDLEI